MGTSTAPGGGLKPLLNLGFKAAAVSMHNVFTSWWHTKEAPPPVHVAAKHKQRESAAKTSRSVAPAAETSKVSDKRKLHAKTNEETEDKSRAAKVAAAADVAKKLQDMKAKQEARQKEEKARAAQKEKQQKEVAA